MSSLPPELVVVGLLLFYISGVRFIAFVPLLPGHLEASCRLVTPDPGTSKLRMSVRMSLCRSPQRPAWPHGRRHGHIRPRCRLLPPRPPRSCRLLPLHLLHLPPPPSPWLLARQQASPSCLLGPCTLQRRPCDLHPALLPASCVAGDAVAARCASYRGTAGVFPVSLT